MLVPYYDRNGITIYCGDCLELMPQLEPPFDAILCDLPYGTTACAWDTIIPFEPLWENYKRLAKKDGAVVLFSSQPFTSKLVMSNLEWFKYEWVWDKVSGVGFQSVNSRPLKSHELISIFYSSSPTYNPQMVDGLPYIRLQSSGGEYMGEENANFFSGWVTINSGERYPKSILRFSNASQVNKFHPTQKPVVLLQYLIKTYTNLGDLILDNTMGSGTTLLAAQNEGRRAVGIEISEKYCEIAVDRLRQPSFFSIPDKVEVQPEQLALLDISLGGAK